MSRRLQAVAKDYPTLVGGGIPDKRWADEDSKQFYAHFKTDGGFRSVSVLLDKLATGILILYGEPLSQT